MIVIPLSVVSTMVMWKSSQWLGKNIVQSTGQENSMKAWIGHMKFTDIEKFRPMSACSNNGLCSERKENIVGKRRRC